jgi:hypothetical protein
LRNASVAQFVADFNTRVCLDRSVNASTKFT